MNRIVDDQGKISCWVSRFYMTAKIAHQFLSDNRSLPSTRNWTSTIEHEWNKIVNSKSNFTEIQNPVLRILGGGSANLSRYMTYSWTHDQK